ncbi:MAG: monovalent cation/H+ antiporter subunit A [Betaproteobacteria bacterium HGW-Betaproteobacteria-12]|nr:MAG: monovalent cation/H+ antiporter subunit A [Betaproteobacteria bacterium HGW-Betaproteobacteria-12]
MSLDLIVLLPFLGAVLLALMLRAGRNACASSAFAVTLLAFALLMTHAPMLFRGETLRVGVEWLPRLGLNLNFFIDGLGFFFAGLILGIGLLIIIYARFYLAREDPPASFYAYLLLFQGAMLGIVLADNILLLLIFWELTSLSSFLLIGYWKHLPACRQGARMALTVTAAGGLAMIAGMLLLGDIAGSYDISEILRHKATIQASPLYLPALILILGGCFTKSAQFPFHFWLPHAMAAPTPVSAYLHSATMVKAGLFLMARLWPVLAGTEAWFYIVAGTGLATMLIAAWIALFKDDLKGLLAYSTVSHLGLVTFLLGLGTPLAAVAAVFHILNHAIFKAALFMNAGSIEHAAGTRDIRRLGGLLLLMPVGATIALLAAGAMAGVPLLNGFLSKEMMLDAAAQTTWAGPAWLIPALATLAASVSVAYSFRYIVHVYFGQARDDYPRPPQDPPFGLWAPSALLVVAVVAIGLFPAAVAGPLVAVGAGAVVGGLLPDYQLALWHGLTPALGMSLLATAVGLTLLWRYASVRDRWLAAPHPDARTLFQQALASSIRLAKSCTHGLHNGSLQRQLAFLIVAAISIAGCAFLAASHAAGSRPLLAATPVAVVAWLLLAVASVGVAVLHRRRLLALITLGVIGIIVALGFLYFSAPDLALTQIAVEVVTIILMLLALNLLPKKMPRDSSRRRRWRDVGIATLGGLGLGAATWAMLTRDGATLSGYYLENALPGGGGRNVVNVILVDFRGFDTFGEIIVLGIAALVIFALLDGALQGEIGRKLAARVPEQKQLGDRHPVMLVVANRVMLPLALMVGAHIFLRGHDLPGGGFIAGLVVAVALILQYVASGFGWATRRLRIDYHVLIGLGILSAGLTGIAAWLADRPFLTSAFGHFPLPLIGEIGLTSAMGFELGVFLTVVGAVMLALAKLSRVGRWADQPTPAAVPLAPDPGQRPAEEP